MWLRPGADPCWPHWSTPRHWVGDGGPLLEATRALGLEGVVAKRLSSRYLPNRRSGAWVKTKNVHYLEAVGK